MARKSRLQEKVITTRKTEEVWDLGEPSEGVTNGKLDDPGNFHKIGLRLFEGKKPTKASWTKLPEGMKNYYRRCYPKLTKEI